MRFSFQSHNRDNEYLVKACKKLRNKSETGYKALVGLLHKTGLLNVLVEINNDKSLQKLNNSVQDESDLSSQPSSSNKPASTTSCQAHHMPSTEALSYANSHLITSTTRAQNARPVSTKVKLWKLNSALELFDSFCQILIGSYGAFRWKSHLRKVAWLMQENFRIGL